MRNRQRRRALARLSRAAPGAHAAGRLVLVQKFPQVIAPAVTSAADLRCNALLAGAVQHEDVVVGGGQLVGDGASPQLACNGSMGPMRVITLNTWGTRGDWPDRAKKLRTSFDQLDPDIVTMQETVLTAEYQQSREILGERYFLAEQQHREPGREGVPTGQGITTASRWPFGRVFEVDLKLTERTGDFACTSLITEVLAPAPIGRVWVANHFPDWQLDHERERRLQTVAAARALETALQESPGHVIVAGDMDADPGSDSIRFWTGRHVIDDTSVCYRSAWEACRPSEPLVTLTPSNPYLKDPDWPFPGIDHVLVRCGPVGPTLLAKACSRVFDGPGTASDHYGLLVDYEPSPSPEADPHR
jgi:endonuclease/exonuclease/phosphatase (EEP) superfamily protein YafD